MTFAITPADGPVTQGLPGNWLQVKKDGSSVGNANVAVIDIVGDPAEIVASRGVGENAHVITIRRLGAAQAIGWNDTISSFISGSASHANSGTGVLISELGGGIGSHVFASIVGAAPLDVLWSIASWTPASDLTTDPSPSLDSADGTTVDVIWPKQPDALFTYSQGMLVLTCTIDGVPVAVGERLVITSSGGDYTDVAWGPEP